MFPVAASPRARAIYGLFGTLGIIWTCISDVTDVTMAHSDSLAPALTRHRVKAQLQAIWFMGVVVYMMLCWNLVEAVVSSSRGSTYTPGSFCLPDYRTKPEGELEEQSAPHSTSADSGFERLKLVIGRRTKQRRRRNAAAAKSTARFRKHASAMTHPAIDNRRFTEAISSHNSELVSLSEKRSQQKILSVLILVVKGLLKAPTLLAPVPLAFVPMCKPADVSTLKSEAIMTVAGADRLVTNSSVIVPASRATSPLVSPKSQVGQSPVQHSRDIISEEANDVGTDSMSSIAVEDSAVNDSKPSEVVPDEAEEDLTDSTAEVEKESRANYSTSTDIASEKTEEDVAVTSMTASVAEEGEAHSGYSITTDTASSETEEEGSSVVQEEVDVGDLAARDNTSNETEDAKRSVVESADVQTEDAQIQHPTSSDNTSEEMMAESTSSSSPESAAALGMLISNDVTSNTADQHEVHTPGRSTCLSPAPIDAAFNDTFSKETVEVATEGNPEANVAVASTTSNSTAENGTEAKSTRGSSVVNEPRSEKPHYDDPTVSVRQQIRSLTSETPASTGASAFGAVAWPLPSSVLPGFGWTSPSALRPAQPVISSSGVAFSFGGAGWVGRRDLTIAAPRTHTSASPPAKSAFAKRPKSERDALVSTGPGSQTSASAFGSISAFQPLTSAAPTADLAGAMAAHASALSSATATQVAVTQPQPQSPTPPVGTLATHAPTVRCTPHESQRSARPSKSLLASAVAKIKPEENLSACSGALRSHSSFTSVDSSSATHIRDAERRGIANMLSDLYMSGGTPVTSPRARASPPVHQDSARLQLSVHQNTTDNPGAPRSQVSHQDNNSAPLRTHARSSRAGNDDAMQKIVLQMSGEVLTNQFPRPTYAPANPALNTSAPRPNLARPTRASPSTTYFTAPTEQEIQDRLMNREFREFLNAEPAVASSATEVRRARASAASVPLVTNGNAPRPIRAPARPEPPVVYGRDPYAVQRPEPVGDVAEDQSSNKSEGESTARRGTYRGTRAGGRVQKRKQNRLKRLAAGENGGGEGGLSQ
ncbi:hypothetical protein QFC21_000851 [Naganishia friedmannii]|uniref:Uncharacterized protein n=1 Tax=Naganishia friedmannii TaxID=89922 RepID=A0ACC2W8L6_9TREE|nr:hypothetical protein QFC21_000851 [Naganishia friedmannii]